MAKYRKKPVLVEAVRWWKHGDHPEVAPFAGKQASFCDQCNSALFNHGTIPTLEGWHIVCPGDWIITGIKGEHYPCKPDIFEATYESIEIIPRVNRVQAPKVSPKPLKSKWKK